MINLSISYTKKYLPEELIIVSELQDLFNTYSMWEYEENDYKWQCILKDHSIHASIAKIGKRKFKVVVKDYALGKKVIDENYSSLTKSIKKVKEVVTALRLLMD